MMNQNKFTGYIESISDGNYFRNIFGLLGISENYNFLLNIISKDCKILEIGPGTGSFIDFLLFNGFENITCVDLDDRNVNELRLKYQNFKNIKCVYGDGISFLENCNEKFDIIISIQVLEHLNVNYLDKFFNICHNALKNEGLLITETINAQNIFYGHFLRYDDATHLNSFTEKSFVQYGGNAYNYNFMEVKPIGIRKILNGLFNFQMKNKYKDFCGKLIFKNGENVEKDIRNINKNGIIKKLIRFLRLNYFHHKAKRISKHYLSGYTVDSTVFTEKIICVQKKL